MGEPSDRDEAGDGARKRVLAGWAHPASLAVLGTSLKAGGRGSACPEMGSPGQSCRTQAPRQRKWPGGGGLGTDSEMGFRPQRWHHGQLRVPIPRSRKALAPCGDL